jgi:hypothetical protein
MKNFMPLVTGTIVETASFVDANVQTNVTLKYKLLFIIKA